MDDRIIRRLSLIQGQVGGILKMAKDDRNCEEILMQISSVSSSLSSVAKIIMENHITHCINDGVTCGNTDDIVENITEALEQFLKLK